MLECAADLGNNGRNVSFVIGLAEAIRATRNSIPHQSIHMRQIKRNKTQVNILKSLKARGEIMMICFRINRPETVRKLFAQKGSRLGRAARRKIHTHFDYALVNEIQKIIGHFLIKHSTTIRDLTIETDSDMRKTLRIAGLRTKSPNIAHNLADIVAWANTRNFHHKDIVDLLRN